MLKIEIESKDDGRWIAVIPALHGALEYGKTMVETQQNVEVLALRVIADQIEHGKRSCNRSFPGQYSPQETPPERR